MNITYQRDEGVGKNTEINFQQILNQFKGNLVFKRLVSSNTVTPDEHLYRIETNDGHYYILELDFIDNFEDVTNFIISKIGGFKYFVEVKHPPQRLEETGPSKSATLYPVPKDFDQFKKYVNDKYGSFEGYFNFLVKI